MYIEILSICEIYTKLEQYMLSLSFEHDNSSQTKNFAHWKANFNLNPKLKYLLMELLVKMTSLIMVLCRPLSSALL